VSWLHKTTEGRPDLTFLILPLSAFACGYANVGYAMIFNIH
jgi:hypothetical protein